MGRSCQQCGSSEIDEDPARGDAICMGCGAVLEESIVVLENQFQERAGGSGHTLVGQFVTLDRQGPQGTGLGQQESREVTFYKGKKLIEEVGSQLRVNQHCMDTAYNFFKMCVSRNITRGRQRNHVVAACLYMTCRLENTAHLLLDFSDITQVNVFDLGRTVSFVSRTLRINLPTTDPCLYVLRFAVLLDFGDKQKEVVTLATRLVQRMKRDWMATGRRPTGLCGAALLLAARSFNFNRTIGDIVRVVHVSEQVVRRRLDEFSQTPSAGLTVDEFATVDLEHSEDPPAFRESRKKAREEQLMKEELEAESLAKNITPIEDEVERALEKKRREKFKRTPYAKLIGGSMEDPEIAIAERVVINEIIDSVYETAEGGSHPVHNPYAVTPSSLGIQFKKDTIVKENVHFKESEDGELDLEDIDDEEINSYILTENESIMKEKFWMRCNGEHVKEMERRRKEREEQEERDRLDPTKKKKRKSINRKKEIINVNDPMEAIEKIIHEKKLSNKVNYDILKEIEKADESSQPVFMTMDDIGKDPSEIVDEVNRLCAPKLELIDKMESPSMEFALGRPDMRSAELFRGERRRHLRGSGKISFTDFKSQLDIGEDEQPEDVHLVSKSEASLVIIKEEKKPVISLDGGSISLERAPPLRSRFSRVKPNLPSKKTDEAVSSDSCPITTQEESDVPSTSLSSAFSSSVNDGSSAIGRGRRFMAKCEALKTTPNLQCGSERQFDELIADADASTDIKILKTEPLKSSEDQEEFVRPLKRGKRGSFKPLIGNKKTSAIERNSVLEAPKKNLISTEEQDDHDSEQLTLSSCRRNLDNDADEELDVVTVDEADGFLDSAPEANVVSSKAASSNSRRRRVMVKPVGVKSLPPAKKSRTGSR